MLRVEALKSAAEEFLSAALLDDSWDDALSRLSSAAGARGAALMRNRRHRVVSVIASPEIKEPVENYMAGRVPPNSRQVRASHGISKGFRLDHDDYTDAELTRDPYYQEFLRPIGFFWHAVAELSAEPGEEIALSLKRSLNAGPYLREDAVALNAILPDLRAAVRIARRVLDSETVGMVRMLHHRGDPAFELDSSGRVLRMHAHDDNQARPLRIVSRRLVACDRLAQPALDRAVTAAVTSPGASAMVTLTNADGERDFLQIVPVGGRARDVFLAASAVAVLIDEKQKQPQLGFERGTIRDAFALTDREADVAILLSEGFGVPDIAKRLRIQIGTARDYLKSVFEKTGTGRQAELVALLARLRP